MAPEQIEGEEVDARTDIFAFGAVLYEMLTGRTAFQGNSAAGLLGAILRDEPPPVTQIRADVPATLDHLVRSCLEKDPADRIQSAHDVWLQLKWIGESSGAVMAPGVAAVKRRRTFWPASTVAAMLLTAGATWWMASRPGEPGVAARLRYPLPPNQQYIVTTRHVTALSPDGTMLVYAANRQLFLRRLDQLDGEPIRGIR